MTSKEAAFLWGMCAGLAVACVILLAVIDPSLIPALIGAVIGTGVLYILVVKIAFRMLGNRE